MNKVVTAVTLAAAVLLPLTACEPTKDPGKPGHATHRTVFGDGEHAIGSRNVLKTVRALNPASSCSWTLMYDLPKGKVAVVDSGGASSAKKGVKLGGTRTLRYRDPVTHKMVTKKDRPTSFYSENCGTWVNA